MCVIANSGAVTAHYGWLYREHIAPHCILSLQFGRIRFRSLIVVKAANQRPRTSTFSRRADQPLPSIPCFVKVLHPVPPYGTQQPRAQSLVDFRTRFVKISLRSNWYKSGQICRYIGHSSNPNCSRAWSNPAWCGFASASRAMAWLRSVFVCTADLCRFPSRRCHRHLLRNATCLGSRLGAMGSGKSLVLPVVTMG
jgi:hypothetical protein